MSGRDVYLDSIWSSLETFNEDELRVMELIASRAAVGAKQYAPLNIRTEARDMLAEASLEHIDACFYMATRHLQRRPCDSCEAHHVSHGTTCPACVLVIRGDLARALARIETMKLGARLALGQA